MNRESGRSRNTRRRNAQGGKRGGGERRKASAIDEARQAALTVIGAVRADGAYANLLLPKELRKRGLKGRDAAFATELTYGTLRAEGLLDAVLAEASTRPLDQIDGPLLDILRMGAYQLLRTRVGAHAAVDTSVKAAIPRGTAGRRASSTRCCATSPRRTRPRGSPRWRPPPTATPWGTSR